MRCDNVRNKLNVSSSDLYKPKSYSQIEPKPQKKLRDLFYCCCFYVCITTAVSSARESLCTTSTSQPQRPQSTDNTKNRDRTSQFFLIPLLFLFVTYSKPFMYTFSWEASSSLRISDTVVTKLPSTSSCHDRQNSALSLCYVLWKLHWFEPCTYSETHYM